MKRQQILTSVLVLGLLLALAVGLSLAQGPEPPEGETGVEGEMDVAAIVPGAIPIQGRLTDKNTGAPLDGTYNLTFSLYEVASGGTALCSDTRSVDVENGLFSDYMDHCYNDLYGQKVWLGIEVGSDGEMTDRQVIYPVPYALSLKPGAVISDTRSGRVLYVKNYGSGQGLLGYSKNHDGVYGWSDASDHAGVSGENFGGGVGVYGWSNGGPAIKAAGRIESTADTEISVSPLSMVHDVESRSDLEFTAYGTAMEVRPEASASGFEYIQIPVSLPNVLFGTPTKFKSVRICYRCDQAGSFVSTTIVGQGTDSGTVDFFINDTTNHTSTSWDCYTVTAATPKEITGSVYIKLTLELAGTGSLHDIRIGNVALTLTEE